MSKQKAPSTGDHHGHGKGVRVVGAGGRGRTEVAPPQLAPGHVRCPVCRNGTSVTPLGRLHQHTDLFGGRCYNKRPDSAAVQFKAPPVVLPKRQQRWSGTATAPVIQPNLPKVVTGLCHECDRPVSGERRYCGRCLAHRMDRRPR